MPQELLYYQLPNYLHRHNKMYRYSNCWDDNVFQQSLLLFLVRLKQSSTIWNLCKKLFFINFVSICGMRNKNHINRRVLVIQKLIEKKKETTSKKLS